MDAGKCLVTCASARLDGSIPPPANCNCVQIISAVNLPIDKGGHMNETIDLMAELLEITVTALVCPFALPLILIDEEEK